MTRLTVREFKGIGMSLCIVLGWISWLADPCFDSFTPSTRPLAQKLSWMDEEF